MTDPRAAKIIDELLTLWHFGEPRREFPDFNITSDALAYIMEARCEHGVAVTVSIIEEMKKRGMVT